MMRTVRSETVPRHACQRARPNAIAANTAADAAKTTFPIFDNWKRPRARAGARNGASASAPGGRTGVMGESGTAAISAVRVTDAAEAARARLGPFSRRWYSLRVVRARRPDLRSISPPLGG